MFVVEPKPDFERAIGEPLFALEQSSHLVQDLVKRHGRPASRSEGICGINARLGYSVRYIAVS